MNATELVAAAKVRGDLAIRLQRVSASAGLSVSALVRQGLIRIITEAEAAGSLTCYPVPPAGPTPLDESPARPVHVSASRSRFRTFEEMMDARMEAAATTSRSRRP